VRVVEEVCNELEMGNNQAGLREISKFTSGVTKPQSVCDWSDKLLKLLLGVPL